jgi:pyruvate kinase
MKRRTKIVCTLGPSVSSQDSIRELIAAGMNVARLNCSHGDWEARRQWIDWVKAASPNLGPIGILADLQGPKFRMEALPGGLLEVSAGQKLSLGAAPGAAIPIQQPEVLSALEVGSRLLIGDGDVELCIDDWAEQLFEARAITTGTIRSRQGVTVVGKAFSGPPLTPKDIADIEQAAAAGVDFIALSYVRAADDMRLLRDHVRRHDPTIRLCAKIETPEAVAAIDEIVAESDVVMVARGDLGLQMDLEDVPLAQKRIIRACLCAGKPVITATQMLESMVRAPRPTRAEAADVANAILDGTDAVMLSGETAAGAHPIESVQYMARIARAAERGFNHGRHIADLAREARMDETEAVASAVAQMSENLRPQAIVTTSTSGQTARLISKYRPRIPILCATWNARTQRYLSVVWGVESAFTDLPETTDEQIAEAMEVFRQQERLKGGDQVIVSAGVPAGTAGNTNLIMVQMVKE